MTSNLKSRERFERAKSIFVGGVNSPVRSFKSVGGTPPLIASGRGSHLTDMDGNTYIDYVGAWGPAILGHAHPKVVAALKQAAELGFVFGASTDLEIQLAEMVQTFFPSLKKMRFVCSGTEATMSALRVARGFTGRSKIIKFDGCYHGHSDQLLVKAGSGLATCGIPDTAGVPAEYASLTLTANYNDIFSVRELVREHPSQIAAIILEPVVGNMGCILPDPEFLKHLRSLCTQEGILLIFDEVMTGFRVAKGGAQELYGIAPDLTCLGKIIGGGMPVAAYGGRAEIMDLLAPIGPVYQAGTLAGHPLGMAAGLATLAELSQPGLYQQLEERTHQLVQGLKDVAHMHSVPLVVNRAGGMFSFFFSDKPVTNAEDARQANQQRFNHVFHHFLANGVYWPPSAFESAFMSFAHTSEDVNRTLEVFAAALVGA